jgi:osmoprotectant transport system ATP-binding protein
VSTAIEFEGVSYRASERELLRDVSFSVAAGETLMLLGRSGSGKTTLLKLINRLLVPERGRVMVSGRATVGWDVIALRRGIGYAIQNVGLFPHYTVEQNVGLLLRLEGKPEATVRARVEEVLRLAGLEAGEYGRRYPAQLSGGEQHRVGIARALAADPPVLLMDEPFGALDPLTRTQLQFDFHQLAKRLGKTVVFVTHDLNEALRLADRIAFLHEGTLRALLAPEEFMQSSEASVREYLDAFQAGQQRISA